MSLDVNLVFKRRIDVTTYYTEIELLKLVL